MIIKEKNKKMSPNPKLESQTLLNVDERIKQLQSDSKFSFKQTSDIIEIIYKTAISDLNNIKNSVDSNKDNEDILRSKLIEQVSLNAKIKTELDELKKSNENLEKQNKRLKILKLPTNKIDNKSNDKNQELSECEIIKQKLKAYNYIFDLIYFKKYDLMTLYQELKEEIYNLNFKLKVLDSKYKYVR